ncbi:MAG: sugar-specific transcriptional regulator TrmB [Candidatus Nitrosomirales archaeon]
MASTYEFVEHNYIHSGKPQSNVRPDLELLNSRIAHTLLDLGLNEEEAKVVLFLSKKGEMKASEIAKNVGIARTRLYFILETLQGKGLIVSTVERPAKYRALPLEKAVDLLIESYKHKLHTLEKTKKAISHDWASLQEYEVVRNPEPEDEDNLQFISGEHRIYNKAERMIIDAAKQVDVFVNARNLSRISYEEITDKLQLLASNGISVRILTNAALCERSLLEEIDRCSIREIPHDLNDRAHFIIVDNKELLLLNLDRAKEASALLTNSSSLVDAMSFLFGVGWRTACVHPTTK